MLTTVEQISCTKRKKKRCTTTQKKKRVRLCDIAHFTIASEIKKNYRISELQGKREEVVLGRMLFFLLLLFSFSVFSTLYCK